MCIVFDRAHRGSAGPHAPVLILLSSTRLSFKVDLYVSLLGSKAYMRSEHVSCVPRQTLGRGFGTRRFGLSPAFTCLDRSIAPHLLWLNIIVKCQLIHRLAAVNTIIHEGVTDPTRTKTFQNLH